MNVLLRVERYAERFFLRKDEAEWPTVRRTAKSLGIKQRDVIDAIMNDADFRLMLTGYNFCDEGDKDYPGSLYVELL